MLSKKDRSNPILMEARKILLNHVDIDKDGRFIATEKGHMASWGMADGEQRIRTLGVSRKEYIYHAKVDDTKAVYSAGQTMNNIGRRVNLRSDEDAVACMFKSYIFYPVVMVFRKGNLGELELLIFTARTFTTPLAVLLARRQFDKNLPDTFERIENKRSIKDILALGNVFRHIKLKRFGKKKKEDDDEVWDGENWVPADNIDKIKEKADGD